MVFKATFNNILVISWRSVSLLEEFGIPRENHRPTLSHNVVSNTPRWLSGIRLTLVVIGTDCIQPYDHDHDGPFHSMCFICSTW